MITLKDLGELPEKQEMLPEEPLVNKINIAIKAQNSKIDQIANIDLAPALKKAGYVKLEDVIDIVKGWRSVVNGKAQIICNSGEEKFIADLVRKGVAFIEEVEK